MAFVSRELKLGLTIINLSSNGKLFKAHQRRSFCPNVINRAILTMA